ncbi:GNAT family N-acetyltransferase [Candidatus Microgenomates bacterium]|nr:MAG: GNAT family N-acetyltransferase [Candidatus Microgenomates bacterium]
MNFSIRTATRDELQIMLDWAHQEGWNPGIYDADSFYAADNQGFLLGFLDNEPIAAISAVAYDQKFGFLGLYIVKSQYRKQGYGIQIWQEALKHLPTQNIGLDGVVAAQASYKKSGFTLAYRNIRYEGRGKKVKKHPSEITALSNIPFSRIIKYDNQVFPAQRTSFLKQWIKQPESLAVGYVKNQDVLGIGMVRKCHTGYKVGPLFADNEKVADALLQKMQDHVGDSTPIFLDVPEPNQQAVKLAEKYNMKPMFETARMYTKTAPPITISKIFGVTTFELG